MKWRAYHRQHTGHYFLIYFTFCYGSESAQNDATSGLASRDGKSADINQWRRYFLQTMYTLYRGLVDGQLFAMINHSTRKRTASILTKTTDRKNYRATYGTNLNHAVRVDPSQTLGIRSWYSTRRSADYWARLQGGRQEFDLGVYVLTSHCNFETLC